MKQLDITEMVPAPSVAPTKTLSDLDRDVLRARRQLAAAKRKHALTETTDRSGLKRANALIEKWKRELEMSQIARESREDKLLAEMKR